MADNRSSSSNALVSPLLKLPFELLVQIALANSNSGDDIRDVVNLKRSCAWIYQTFKRECVVEKVVDQVREVLPKQDPALNGQRRATEYPCYGCLQIRHARFFGYGFVRNDGDDDQDLFINPSDATLKAGIDLQVAMTRRCFFCRLRDKPRDLIITGKELHGPYHTFRWCERCNDVGWWTVFFNHEIARCPIPNDCRRCSERDRERLKQEIRVASAEVKMMEANLTCLSGGSDSMTTSAEFQNIKMALEQARKLRATKMMNWQRAFHKSQRGGENLRDIDQFYANKARQNTQSAK